MFAYFFDSYCAWLQNDCQGFICEFMLTCFVAGVDYYECSAICGIGIVDVLNGVAMTGLGLVKKKSSSLSLWKRYYTTV